LAIFQRRIYSLTDIRHSGLTILETETTVLQVLSDILRAVDSDDLALLTLLDLSAAFDNVDPATLLRRLSES
jgi:hypothetical protein